MDELQIKELIIKLHTILESEKTSSLKGIDGSIYKKAQKLMEELRFYKDINSNYARYYDNIYNYYDQIIKNRLYKIVNAVLNGKEIYKDYMTEEEYQFYQSLKKLIDGYMNKMLNFKSTIKIEILEDVEEYFDFNGNKQGPYFKGQIIEIDENEASWLIKNGKAKILNE